MILYYFPIAQNTVRVRVFFSEVYMLLSPIHTMELLSATFECIILYCTDDETFVCNFTLPVALSPQKYVYMHLCI